MKDKSDSVLVSFDKIEQILNFVDLTYKGGKTCAYADLLSLHPEAVYILPMVMAYAESPKPLGLGDPSMMDCIVHDDRSSEAERLAMQVLLENN